MRRLLTIALVLTTLTYTGRSGAEAPSPCQKAMEGLQEALNACDRALGACQQVVTAQDLSITQLKEDQDRLLKDLAKAKERESALPTWLVMTLGVLGGFAVGAVLAK